MHNTQNCDSCRQQQDAAIEKLLYAVLALNWPLSLLQLLKTVYVSQVSS
jgi:hypothetical protein